MKRKNASTNVAQLLTDAEIEQILKETGDIVTGLMAKTTIERFAYETGLSRSQVDKYRHGKDMLLSTFLRLTHGLGVAPEHFFKKVAESRNRNKRQ